MIFRMLSEQYSLPMASSAIVAVDSKLSRLGAKTEVCTSYQKYAPIVTSQGINIISGSILSV